MTEREDDSFEVLLDSVLWEGAEPRAGLEQRILARVRADQLPVIHRVWRYIATAYIVVALPLVAVAIFLVLRRPELPSARKPAEIVFEQPTPLAIEVQHAALPRAVMHHAALHKTAEKKLPKQDVFPSPVTATAEGRSLAEWSQQQPKEARHLLKLQQTDSASAELIVEPIRIAAIEVPLLRH